MPPKNVLYAIGLFFCAAIGLIGLSGCGSQGDRTSPSLFEINLQTDWFPQPEHGGFYQALANGYYEEAGLQVNIIPGGPNSMSTQKILKGKAHFAMNRADTIYMLASRDVPALMVMATLQHDPQGILLHADNPISRLEDLGGQSVMAIPGLMWIRWLEAKYKIQLRIIPHDYGMERFINDEAFIQQCMITNEPYYVQQAGAKIKVLPLRESGFDPYHGIYCLKSFAEEHPEIVRRFVQASIRGWIDFIQNDPTPAFQMIAARNPKMDQGFMEYSYGMLRGEALVTGMPGTLDTVGNLDPARMETLVEEMHNLGLVISSPGQEHHWYTREFLKPVDAPSDGHP